MLDRLEEERISDGDRAFLRSDGFSIDKGDLLGKAAHMRGMADRTTSVGTLDYLILVPTLRCNLSCSYRRMSRVAEAQRGFDWSEETLAAVLTMIDLLDAPRL
ncbi:hypothetical protein [Sphingomonas sp. R86521]|uniref:hypothetical protein n=1 Tax=Sphingomonas sp. R86521 TaxID=3093860 RepID=UPI0036D2AAE4